ncbi:hypothetical protein [Muriicola soli]|uniref:Uncharacterized protein n=1 Tax=Muriicola soli TaxID=2507538 RepID=A0A411E892_9FLAO|nr:hypothetical protein [Muriicola soli]QBA63670.1 hypothetical protein EQY75_03375 [Muriicola soli]
MKKIIQSFLNILIIICWVKSFSQIETIENVPIDNVYMPSKKYGDIVQYAQDIIKKTDLVWTPLSKDLITLTYSDFIVNYATEGGGYILLESPSLAIDFIQGGFWNVKKSLAKDFLLEIAKKSINHPEEIAKNVAKATIDEGLSDYYDAFNIVSKYSRSKKLSRQEALHFIEKKWGFMKLSAARKLISDIISNNYEDPNKKLTRSALNDVYKKMEEALNINSGSSSEISNVDAAFFVWDLSNLMMEAKVGIMNYKPYVDFRNRMIEINNLMMEEIKSWKPWIEITIPNSQTRWIKGESISLEWTTFNIPEDIPIEFILAKGGESIQKIGPFSNKGFVNDFRTQIDLEEGDDYRIYGYELFPLDGENYASYETPYFKVISESNKDPLGTEKENKRQRFAGRNISYIKEIEVNSSEITISLWDHGRQDGDIVSIYLNGEVITSNHSLTNSKANFRVQLNPERANDLMLYAHNLGSIPPNTVSISINDQYQSEDIVLNSDLMNSEAVILKVAKH